MAAQYHTREQLERRKAIIERSLRETVDHLNSGTFPPYLLLRHESSKCLKQYALEHGLYATFDDLIQKCMKDSTLHQTDNNEIQDYLQRIAEWLVSFDTPEKIDETYAKIRW